MKEILEHCVSIEHMNEREKFWIAELDARNKDIGYNIAKGGLGGDTMSTNPNKKEIFEKIQQSMLTVNAQGFSIKQLAEQKRQLTLTANPQIKINSHLKRNNTLKNNPDIMINAGHARSLTCKTNPEINKKRNSKIKSTLRNNPQIMINAGKKISKTFKDNPEIMINAGKNISKTFKNNPNIMINACKNRLRTLKNNPDIMINSINNRRKTYENKPEILRTLYSKMSVTNRNKVRYIIHNVEYTNLKNVKAAYNTLSITDIKEKLKSTDLTDWIKIPSKKSLRLNSSAII